MGEYSQPLTSESRVDSFPCVSSTNLQRFQRLYVKKLYLGIVHKTRDFVNINRFCLRNILQIPLQLYKWSKLQFFLVSHFKDLNFFVFWLFVLVLFIKKFTTEINKDIYI